MIAGILSGLGAAVSQSLSYLGTRHFNHNRKNPARQLLVLGHLWMGLFGAIVLLLEWPREADPWQWLGDAQVRQSVLLMTFFYIFGQVGTTLALRFAEPSRVSPLLGIKIIFIAGLSAFWPQPQVAAAAAPVAGLSGMQWAGVILAVVAAVALNYAGAALRKRAIAAILLACTSFTFADWNIAAANRDIHGVLPGASSLQVSLLNAGLCYVLAAMPALALAPFWGTRKARDWLDAAPFAVAWYGGMLCLYWCYAEVGPMLGVILQSTRGLISILIGSLLIYLGHLHIEPHHPRRVLWRRLGAGALMFAAVSLYVIKDPANIKIGWWHLP